MQTLSADQSLPLFQALGAPSADEGMCGLALQSAQGNAVARLLVSRHEYTQKTMYELAQAQCPYEPVTSQVAVQILRPGDIALDIGAHVGYFAMLFRLAVGASGTVFAFEPLAETYRRLLNNVMINGFTNVLPLAMAVADRMGVANFHQHQDNEGESSLFADAGPTAGPVQVVCLDELFKNDLPARPRLIKIDAEGAELLILQGAAEWFKRQAPDFAIVEINRGALARCGIGESDVRQFFVSRGYRAGAINNAAGDMGFGQALVRYFDADYPAVPEDYRYVYNELYVRQG